jgi:hypothetical protein
MANAAPSSATVPGMAKSKTLAVRLPDELLRRIEVVAAAYREKLPPGIEITTSDVIRSLLERALQLEEGGDQEKRAGKRRR